MRRRGKALLSPAFVRTADATYSSGPITQQKAALYLSRDRTAAGFTAGKGSVVGQVLMLPKLRDSYFAC